MITARQLGYSILLQIERQISHPDRLLARVLQRHSRLPERDRALLTELVYGTLRWQLFLDWHVDQLSRIDPKKIDPAIRVLLRLALYQILHLDRIPPHAAVNESVEIARASQPKHLQGFVNAVLREALRRGGNWPYPSAEKSPVEHLSVMTSHPRWFVDRMVRDLGVEDASRLCTANNAVAPLSLRVNTLKATVEAAREALIEAGLNAEVSDRVPASLRVSGMRSDLSKLSAFGDGWIQPQDEASQLVSRLLAPAPGERVLDLCAGFGVKSSHMANLMENRGEIVSVDNAAWKLADLEENCARQGIGIVKTVASDALELDPAKLGLFDRVLVDAPCTGFGTLRRNPDIKWQRSPKDPYRFGRIQKDLLAHATKFVRPGGCLVYATCTLFREENEDVAATLVAEERGWDVLSAASDLPESCASMAEEGYLRTWPHRDDMDGFFAAKWRRLT